MIRKRGEAGIPPRPKRSEYPARIYMNLKYRLTERGERKVRDYILELKAKRKEILDAGKDTADFELPTIKDILSDMNWSVQDFGEGYLEYINSWGVTDNYNADFPLGLTIGADFTKIAGDQASFTVVFPSEGSIES